MFSNAGHRRTKTKTCAQARIEKPLTKLPLPTARTLSALGFGQASISSISAQGEGS